MKTFDAEEQLSLFVQDGSAGKMCLEPSAAGNQRERTSGSSSRRSSGSSDIPFLSLDLTPGHGNLLGEFYWELISPWRGGSSTLNTGPAPRSGEGVSTLSQILQADPPPGYFLTRRGCLGILRRSVERGKPLPTQLKIALELQVGLRKAFPAEWLKGPVAFAANQRDEVRDLHNVAGALGAQPGMKQQTFVAGIVSKGNGDCFLTPERHTSLSGGGGQAGQGYPCILNTGCLNPWDTQQARVFTPEGTAPTLAGADGGEGRATGRLLFSAGFSAGAGKSAGSIGYQEGVAPTLKGSASGNMAPSILCLNDQGGNVMECTENISGTLRAQEHGHQPLIFENHALDARYTGPHSIVPTLSASGGMGGNNLPLVSSPITVFSRQRTDHFREDDVASTESARQFKDATDLILQMGNEPACLLIRRLTPLECERLQGYPDGWTALPGASDSARYKALGNSVCIPCVEYIMRGIALVDRAA